MYIQVALTDITNVQFTGVQKLKPAPARHHHDPYSWKCIKDEDSIFLEEARITLPPVDMYQEPRKANNYQTPPAPSGPTICFALIQFKCHQAEYRASFAVEAGQYVVVQGDRGMDIGAVVRVDPSESAETSLAQTGGIIRYATQIEVDYWANELKDAEAEAVVYCQSLIYHHSLEMEIAHAEYQFDKKKLTFYYHCSSRVEFVNLLKDLYREFGCRIWMEKMRAAE